jgi:hypothetical protein
MCGVQRVNWGRLAQMLRECVPNAVQAGGALVVVRGWESQLHGEGGQFKRFAWLIN